MGIFDGMSDEKFSNLRDDPEAWQSAIEGLEMMRQRNLISAGLSLALVMKSVESSPDIARAIGLSTVIQAIAATFVIPVSVSVGTAEDTWVVEVGGHRKEFKTEMGVGLEAWEYAAEMLIDEIEIRQISRMFRDED